MVYRFDEFEVDDREFRLSDGGTPLPVEPKVLRLLLCLIENRNRLVRKQELLDKVWPDVTVTENALTRAIGLLRKSLNDDTHVPKFIETIPTAGYRFIASVTVASEDTTVHPVPPITRMAPIPAPSEPKPRFNLSGKWIFASVLLLATLAAAAFFFFRPRHVLTAKDTVVLANFDNSTGDPVFDGTLRQGMAVQLEQSPFLSLISDERIQQTLRMMGQPSDARLTPAIAREICERTASTAVLDGSIARLGTQYVLGLRARGCSNGKILAEEQVQAARKEDVLNALGQIAGKFRTQVGESLTTVEKYDTPLAEATTSSLEALKAFSLGRKTMSEGGQTAALPFFSRAVELDPNFAAAYAAMSGIYAHHQEPERSAEMIRKAFALRDKVSERERFSIESSYYWYGTGELEKAVSSLELWRQTYPRDWTPYNGLGVIYRWLGVNEKALEYNLEAQRLAPNSTGNYQNLGADYVNLNRFDDAATIYKEAEQRNLPYEGRTKSRYLLAFLQGDTTLMSQLASSAKGKRLEDAMLAAEADTEAWYGRSRQSRELTRQAVDSAIYSDAKESAAGYLAQAALFEAGIGDLVQARADANEAMKVAPNRDVKKMAALAFAQIGDTARAETLAAELDKAHPLDTLIQRYWLPAIRAAVALQRKDPGRAVELLPATGATELGPQGMFAVYLRGEAYLMLHDGDRAVTEFQKFIDHRGPVRNSPTGAMARLGVARAYALQSNTTKARAAYQDFLTLWKSADPDIPLLQQAKTEYAALQ